jgi:uncharacterized SAM-binding protein YcdF (DUF218 family)
VLARVARAAGWCLLGGALLGVAATARLFVWPTSNHPRHADAVVILAGDPGERLDRALELLHAGVSTTLVVDGSDSAWKANALCGQQQPFTVLCIRPNPDSTRAEARDGASLADQRGWNSITVVTTTFHVTRARVLFGRCYHGKVSVVGAPRSQSLVALAREVTHEWAGLAYATVWSRGC